MTRKSPDSPEEMTNASCDRPRRRPRPPVSWIRQLRVSHCPDFEKDRGSILNNILINRMIRRRSTGKF